MILPGTKTPVGELINKTYSVWTHRRSVLDCLNPHQLLEHSQELCSVIKQKREHVSKGIMATIYDPEFFPMIYEIFKGFLLRHI